MKLYALYGTSGTGKSTIALRLAHQLNVDAIIDDGILISQGRKVAGVSAKYEKTKIQAVKRAIFYYQEHAAEVRKALQDHAYETLLILGTSQRMIHRITRALQLTDPIEFIPIEDLKTPAEMDAARYMRETQGRHVIPVPRVEIEKDFFQKIISHAQQILSPKKEVLGETTVVHPSFSGGRIQIHEQVLRKIVQITCQRFEQVKRIHKTTYTFHDLPRLTVQLSLGAALGDDLLLIVEQLQQALYDETSYCLNISPASIDVHIVSLELAP
ncbi:hypothetical protein ACTID9_24680 [Brevibacillus fluminis]|uniref:hypothetical protein n=1 Tax=Brevibacillus fluminis TaxID=511487 RepID=UPI003F8B94CD